MADAPINELFEEAVAQCQDLTDEAQALISAIDDLMETAEDLVEDAVDQVQQVHTGTTALAERIEEYETAIEQSGATARQQLGALAAGAERAQAQVGTVLDRIRHGLLDLETAEKDVAQRLADRLMGTTDDLDRLLEQARGLQEAVSHDLEQAGVAIGELTSAVHIARAEWEAQRAAVLESMDGLDEIARDQTQAYADQIAAALDRQGTEVLVSQLANSALIPAYNQAVAVLERELIEEPPGLAEAMLAPLLAALQDLERTAIRHQEALGTGATDVQQRTAEALAIIQAAQSTLAEAARIA